MIELNEMDELDMICIGGIVAMLIVPFLAYLLGVML